ncbi:hypothetical protein JL720_12778 [Aureococcus anophagefferens]|nr:hypothetical protein JL720_12778 [Aureococcus anophagefferens]
MKEILAASKRAMSTEGMGSLETLLEKIEEKRRSSLTPVEAKDEDAAACASRATARGRAATSTSAARRRRGSPRGRGRSRWAWTTRAAIDDDDVDAKMFHLDRLLGAVLSVAKVEMGVDRAASRAILRQHPISLQDAASRRDVVGDAAIDDGDRASAWSSPSCARRLPTGRRSASTRLRRRGPPPLADDLATGYRTKTILAVPVAVDRVASTGLACDDEPWTKLGVLLFTNKFFNHSKEDGEGEVLHVAGRASDQGERRTTRIVEVGAFNDFDCARARGLVDAIAK